MENKKRWDFKNTQDVNYFMLICYLYYLKKGDLKIKGTDKLDVAKDDSIEIGKLMQKARKTVDSKSEEGMFLTSIGMIWNFKENREKVKEICKNLGCNMNADLNKYIIKFINAEQLIGKTKFLESLGEKPVNSYNCLSLSLLLDPEGFYRKYNIMPEEVVNKFVLNRNIKKQDCNEKNR